MPTQAPGSKAAAEVKRRRDQRKKQRKPVPAPLAAAASDRDSSGSEMQLAAEEAPDAEAIGHASPTAAAVSEPASAERGSRQDKRHEVCWETSQALAEQ